MMQGVVQGFESVVDLVGESFIAANAAYLSPFEDNGQHGATPRAGALITQGGFRHVEWRGLAV
jgi:hypothetical protein